MLGSQRRVWCPKWTPASSSSLMPTSAIRSLAWLSFAGLGAGRGPGRFEPPRIVRRRQRRVRDPLRHVVRRIGAQFRDLAALAAGRARSSAAARSAGQRRARTRAARPSRGCVEAELGRRAGTAARVRACRAARSWDRRRSDGRSPVMWARIWCVRPVSSRTWSSASRPTRSATSKWVTAGRGRRPPTTTRSGARWSRPSGASIVPVREEGQPSTRAR